MASLRLRALLRQVAHQGRQRAQEIISKSFPLVGAASVYLCLASQDGWHRECCSPSLRSFLDGCCQHNHVVFLSGLKTTSCDGLLEVETAFPGDFNESDRFFQVLEYHRTLLQDYTNRWAAPTKEPSGQKSWPRKIPSAEDIPALEMDFRFCKRSSQSNERACQDLQFRIGAYYVTAFKDKDSAMQMKGYRMIKDLAERGHPDGMCYYGKNSCLEMCFIAWRSIISVAGLFACPTRVSLLVLTLTRH